MESNYEAFVPFSLENGLIGKTVHEVGRWYGLNIKMIDGNGVFMPGSKFNVIGDHMIIRKMRNELDLW